jgi:hypothetical protein
MAAMGLAPSAIGNAQSKPKPDLVVTTAKKSGPSYALKGDDVTLSFKDVTENQGDKTAGRSRTGMLLVPKHTRTHVPPVKLASRDVPKLAPGKSDSGKASDTVSTDVLPLGAYKVEVCADVKKQVRERKEGNDCKRAGSFYVVQDVWNASVNGVGPDGTAALAEGWESSGATLRFGEYLAGGVFRYDFSGNVTWDDDGTTTGGCKVSGHGEKGFLFEPAIKLDYAGGTYRGKVVTDRFYTISYTPPPGGSPYCNAQTVPGPSHPEIVYIKKPKSLMFDQDELKGRFNIGGAVTGTTWNWDFY